MIHIKRDFMSGVWVVALLGLSLFTACTTSDDSTVSTGRVLMVNGSVGGGSTSRTAVDITDPQNLHPDYTKGEGFLWTDGDKVAAYCESTDGATNATKADIEATKINKATADFAIPIEGLPASGKCYMYYPSRIGNSGNPSLINLTMTKDYRNTDYGLYDYMYADPIDYTTTTDLQGGYSTRFHHLGALLRFNIWNKTAYNYVVSNLTIQYKNAAGNGLEVIPLSGTCNLKSPSFTSSGKNDSQMSWNNANYTTDKPLIDDLTTTDRNEAVYDALLPILPTQGVADGNFVITLTLYNGADKSTKQLDITIPCSRYNFFTNGFKSGLRYYFSIDIDNEQARLKNITVSPWDEGTTTDGTFSKGLIYNQQLIEILSSEKYKVPKGSDGYIHPEDPLVMGKLNEITSIEVYNKNITSLEGIQYLKNLKDLYCANNQLTSLDVSKNTALETLSCYNNQLTSLDVSKNTALTSLSCDNNQLTSLGVSKNTALGTLSCDNNQLTSLDVSNNTALGTLICGTNQLTSLDVSKNTALKTLDCAGNQLTSLDVSKNTALVTLYCGNNQLASLGVSKNTALKTLVCDNNQLASLDVSKNTALETLFCGNNQLTSLDVSKNTALVTVSCSTNQLTSLDVSKNTALETLSCYNNQLTSLDVSKNTALTALNCLLNRLSALDITHNQLLTSISCNNQSNSEGSSQTLTLTLTAAQKTKLAKDINDVYDITLKVVNATSIMKLKSIRK